MKLVELSQAAKTRSRTTTSAWRSRACVCCEPPVLATLAVLAVALVAGAMLADFARALFAGVR